MIKNDSFKLARPLERWLFRLDAPPCDAFYRGAFGFLVLPTMSLLLPGGGSGWALIPFLFVVLVLLRVLPAVLRRLLPFSEGIRRLWSERRLIGKRYDSYQWQKLLWMGTGLMAYTMISGFFSTPRLVVSLFCLLSGAVGLAKWRATAVRLHSPYAPPNEGHGFGAATGS